MKALSSKLIIAAVLLTATIGASALEVSVQEPRPENPAKLESLKLRLAEMKKDAELTCTQATTAFYTQVLPLVHGYATKYSTPDLEQRAILALHQASSAMVGEPYRGTLELVMHLTVEEFYVRYLRGFDADNALNIIDARITSCANMLTELPHIVKATESYMDQYEGVHEVIVSDVTRVPAHDVFWGVVTRNAAEYVEFTNAFRQIDVRVNQLRVATNK